MSATLRLLSAAAAAVIAAGFATDAAPKLNVTLYSESLCPDCIHFITGAWADVYSDESLRAIVNWDQVVFGNAQISGSTITCQHGAEECKMNLLQTCAIHYAAGNTSQWLPFILCLEKHGDNQERYARQCAESVGYAWTSLNKCWTGAEGEALELAAGAATPNHDFVPWVTGLTDAQGANSTFCTENGCDNFREVLCSAYTGPKPTGCSAAAISAAADAAEARRSHTGSKGTGSCKA